MGSFGWFRLFNEAQFLALDLVSTMITVFIPGIGQAEIMVYRGNRTSIEYNGDFLSINGNGRNPFRIGERAIFLDPNGDVWLGIYRAN